MRILGLDVGASRTRAVWVEDGRLRARDLWDTPEPAGFRELLASARRLARGRVDRIAIGFAATVDDAHVVRGWPNRPEYLGMNVGELLAGMSAGATICVDDCAAAALGEHFAREAVEAARPSTTLYVGVGTGIGAGAVVGGRLHLGARRSAFGIGHFAVPSSQQAVCSCGRRGCVQAVASGRAIDQLARERGVPSGAVASRAGRGESPAAEIVASAAAALGEAVALAVRFLDPHRVVVGGGMVDAGEALLAPIRAAMVRDGVPCAIEAARLGTWSGAIGAALLALEGDDRAVLTEELKRTDGEMRGAVPEGAR